MKKLSTTRTYTNLVCGLCFLFICGMATGLRATCPTATVDCPPVSIEGYINAGTYNGHTYFLSKFLASAPDAITLAAATGGHLVTIGDAGENNFVAHAARGGLAWIGFNDVASEGNFVWVTGEPVTFTNWCAEEPNNNSGFGLPENWATINWCSVGGWNDLYNSPNRLNPFIVEFDNACGDNLPVSCNGTSYSIPESQLFIYGSACGLLNLRKSDYDYFGFYWNDNNPDPPVSVTVEFFIGMDFNSNGTEHTIYLNDVPQTTFTSIQNVGCEGGGRFISLVLNPAHYHPNSQNYLFIDEAFATGFQGNLDGVYATVCVVYPCGNDTDGDGICNETDNCPNTANADQADADGDGLGNACDACPNDPNKTAPGTCGCGVADTDTDGDGLANCVDPDDDNDGCLDTKDPHPLTYSPDADCDGVGNDCDVCLGGDDKGPCNATSLPPVSSLPPNWICSNNNNSEKIKMCHSGQTICVSENAVKTHLDHGDFLGPCTSCTGQNLIAPTGNGVFGVAEQLEMNLTPNPAGDLVNIELHGMEMGEGMLTIFDPLGRVVLTTKLAEGTHQLPLELPTEKFGAGRYFVRVVSGEGALTKILVITR